MSLIFTIKNEWQFLNYTLYDSRPEKPNVFVKSDLIHRNDDEVHTAWQRPRQAKFDSKEITDKSIIGHVYETMDQIACRFDSSTFLRVKIHMCCGQVATTSHTHIEVLPPMDLVQRKSNFLLALPNHILLGGMDDPSNLELN
jgi:hypothetical protein